MNRFRYYLLLICILICQSAYLQTPTDALLMKKNQICVATMYSQGSWDQYWEGANLKSNGNVGTFTSVQIVPMAAYGITNDLMAFVSIPHISNSTTGGQLNSAAGWQDLSLQLKYRAINKDIKKSTISLFVSGGYSTPLTSYNTDYLPQGLGLGCDEYNIRSIGYIEYNKSLYARLMAGYLIRGYTTLERDYHYVDGSKYSQFLDVPNTVQTEMTIGSWIKDKKVQAEIAYISHNTVNGDDIRSHNAPQASNQMDAQSLQMRLRYFPISNLSVLGGYSYTLSGRNVGQAQGFNVGLTYQFYTKKQVQAL